MATIAELRKQVEQLSQNVCMDGGRPVFLITEDTSQSEVDGILQDYPDAFLIELVGARPLQRS
jgi:hypothetical protein